MKINKGTFWKDLLTQVIVLGVFGFGLVWIIRNRGFLTNLGHFSWLRFLLPVTIVLYIWLFSIAVRSLMANYFLKRYDPGDPESVRELGTIKKYRIKGRWPRPEESIVWVRRMLNLFQKNNAREVSRRTFGIVHERPATTPFQGMLGRTERLILLYRPILNVLIEDRLLSEASTYILKNKKHDVRRNCILLISDMDNDTEMLSSAAGVVNYLVKLDQGNILYPFLLDLHHGRLFYPQDHSMMTWADNVYFNRIRNDIMQIMENPRPVPLEKKPAPKTPSSTSRQGQEKAEPKA